MKRRTLKDYAGQIKAIVIAPSSHLGALIRDLMQYSIGTPDVMHVRSTGEALEALLARRCNLILIDIGKPDRDVLALIDQVRKGHGTVPRELPIIAMTHTPTLAVVEQLRDLGVNEILAIPVTAAHLTDRLKSVFEKPRGWVLSPRYVGPDRRRKKKAEGASKQRRGTDDEVGDDALTLTDAVESSAPAAPHAKG